MSNNVEIQANLGRIKESLGQIETNAKVLSEFGKEENIKNNETLITESSKILKESATNANNMIDKLLEIINNSTTDNSNNFILNNTIDNINNFLKILDSVQIGAIGHIFVSITIIFCI
jgi:hypothetical protein